MILSDKEVTHTRQGAQDAMHAAMMVDGGGNIFKLHSRSLFYVAVEVTTKEGTRLGWLGREKES